MSLTGKHIIVTRPIHQNQAIQTALQQLGAHTYSVPLLAIRPTPCTLPNSSVDYIIFTSPNAVKFGVPYLAPYLACTNTPSPTPTSQRPLCVAIGCKTAKALQQQHIMVDSYPESGQFNSEQLLTQPLFQCLQKKTVWIIRGQEGRDLLAQSLTARGAQVDYLAVYHRSCPAINLVALENQSQTQQIDMIMMTSAESLRNLYQSAQQTHGMGKTPHWLKQVPLLLGSQRMQSTAQQLGHCGTLCIAENPSDEAMVQALVQHFGA
ncbi:MAG: uroporphyrinogen-III synthase [bacterium]